MVTAPNSKTSKAKQKAAAKSPYYLPMRKKKEVIITNVGLLT